MGLKGRLERLAGGRENRGNRDTPQRPVGKQARHAIGHGELAPRSRK